jgi:Holliday junction DNA helicase RuvA
MIAHLKGKVLKKTDKGIILSPGNIGYFVHITKDLLSTVKKEAEFFIHTNIKEDAQDLYGFVNYEDLEFFVQLISVKGIGPKVAMEIMNIPTEKLKPAIISEDEIFICRIPGIGKKTAKRLILELKDKIETDRIHTPVASHSEAIDALLKLGYQRKDITKNLREIPESITETEEIITYFLKNA